ncbi:hypothetical protein [Radiobacillus sp. PE A8.2]|uniref:hypothetical protein n=1 Tax=Radiobacillus sp. PE A8.2 TaxID=3380349 RepID=UPI0038900FE3
MSITLVCPLLLASAFTLDLFDNVVNFLPFKSIAIKKIVNRSPATNHKKFQSISLSKLKYDLQVMVLTIDLFHNNYVHYVNVTIMSCIYHRPINTNDDFYFVFRQFSHSV